VSQTQGPALGAAERCRFRVAFLGALCAIRTRGRRHVRGWRAVPWTRWPRGVSVFGSVRTEAETFMRTYTKRLFAWRTPGTRTKFFLQSCCSWSQVAVNIDGIQQLPASGGCCCHS